MTGYVLRRLGAGGPRALGGVHGLVRDPLPAAERPGRASCSTRRNPGGTVDPAAGRRSCAPEYGLDRPPLEQYLVLLGRGAARATSARPCSPGSRCRRAARRRVPADARADRVGPGDRAAARWQRSLRRLGRGAPGPVAAARAAGAAPARRVDADVLDRAAAAPAVLVPARRWFPAIGNEGCREPRAAGRHARHPDSPRCSPRCWPEPADRVGRAVRRDRAGQGRSPRSGAVAARHRATRRCRR